MKNNIILKLKEKFNKEFKDLDNLIRQTLPSGIQILEEILNYIQQFNGKRIRTILLFLFYDYFSKQRADNDKALIKIALSIEFIHNATLFHDDVVDNNQEFRRGVRPANQIWHNKLCILSGDFLLSKAFEKIIETNKLKVSEILSKTSSMIIQGEVKQLIFNQYNSIETYTFEDYLQVIFEKTSVLFASSTEIGAILGGYESQENIVLAKQFGEDLGTAFQIMDDILDYFGDQQTLGKQIGTDFFERKITLPVILLFKKITKSRWNEIWPEKEKEKVEMMIFFEKFLSELKAHNIFEESIEYVKEYVQKSKETLKKLKKASEDKDGEFFANLEEILEFLIIRKT